MGMEVGNKSFCMTAVNSIIGKIDSENLLYCNTTNVSVNNFVYIIACIGFKYS